MDNTVRIRFIYYRFVEFFYIDASLHHFVATASSFYHIHLGRKYPEICPRCSSKWSFYKISHTPRSINCQNLSKVYYCTVGKQDAPFAKGELGRIDRLVHHPLLLHWFHLISGFTQEIDHSEFSRQMAGTYHEKSGLLRKELLHLLLKNLRKRIRIRFMLFFYVFKYVVKYSESVDVPYRYKDEHNQQKG